MARILPFQEGYTAESNPVPASARLPWLSPPMDSPPAVPVEAPPLTPSEIRNVVPGETWAATLEHAAVNAATQAMATAVPQLKKTLGDYITSYTTAVLSGQSPPVIPTVSVTTATGEELTILSAKSRAFRTFFIGMGISVLYALVNIIGSLSQVDFFSKEGWVVLGALVIQTVIATVVSYVARIKIAPPYSKPLDTG